METPVTQNQLVEVYKMLIEQETANHTTATHVLLGLTAILMVVTWWWNKTGATKYISSKVEKEINKQRVELEKGISKKVDEKLEEKIKSQEKRFTMMEADIYRSFAFSLKTQNIYSHSVLYCTLAIEKFLILGDGPLVRTLVIVIIEEIERNKEKKIHSLDSVKKIVPSIPSTLEIEKNKILDLLKEFEDI